MDVYMEYDDNKGVLSNKPYIQTMPCLQGVPDPTTAGRSLELTLHDKELSFKNEAHITALPTDRPLFASGTLNIKFPLYSG